jgi:acetyl-CoA carboxylase biotin carboxylase subunit
MECNAIHPGYGFLAENPDFAEKCHRARLIFVGPTPQNIRDLGNKTIAKRIAMEAGVPVIPGSLEPVNSLSTARAIAKETGYPLILKASAGGGGRGMRIVRDERDLPQAFESCSNEAMASFGSDEIFLERVVENARHIEIQILADDYGNVVHLGERDCTIQRRHQKLIEEAPSPVISPEVRNIIGECAVRIARQANYRNAGTIEFLVDKSGFYFMEMNTRIQVEHPVTEMVTGLTLVKRQIKIAQGEELDFRQEDIKIHGHAIECRINAEDPARNFLPTPGVIEEIIFPLGPGVRVDSAAFPGSKIPREYDSLIAKIIVHGDTRKEAIARMKRALLELKVKGVRSTTQFHYAIMNDKKFDVGVYDTGYIDKNFDNLINREFENPEVAAIAAALEAYLKTQARLADTALKPVRPEGAWKKSGRARMLWDN